MRAQTSRATYLHTVCLLPACSYHRTVEEASNALAFDGVSLAADVLKIRRPHDYNAEVSTVHETLVHVPYRFLSVFCLELKLLSSYLKPKLGVTWLWACEGSGSWGSGLTLILLYGQVHSGSGPPSLTPGPGPSTLPFGVGPSCWLGVWHA